MKKLAIAITAVVAFTGSAIAADMPVKAPAAPMVRAMSWTGCYVGAGGGYGMWNQDNVLFDDTGSSDTVTNGGRGWFGTVQGGCDYQFAGPYGNWVIGAFGDYDFSNIHGEVGNFTNTVPGGTEKLSSTWAVGGRLGYLVFPKLLAYMSGGYTEARFDDINLTISGAPYLIPAATYHGWFMGSGYEYSLDNFMPGLFWKTEYRFADYTARDNGIIDVAGVSNDPGGCAIIVAGCSQINSHKYVQTIRSELVWRFWTR
jgi:outer membrane immunogenic protein